MGLDHFGKNYRIGEDREIKLQLWDTGGMERVASITSSYYKFSEAAILVFALDNPVGAQGGPNPIPGYLPHPLPAPPRHRHIRRERQDLPVSEP